MPAGMASGDDAKAIAEYVAGGLKGEAPASILEPCAWLVMDQMEQGMGREPAPNPKKK